MNRGYQIFPRSQKYRDNWSTIFRDKNSPAKDDRAIGYCARCGCPIDSTFGICDSCDIELTMDRKNMEDE